jgi:hypothetical protein
MFNNIENAITDTEVLVGGNHFPIKGEYTGFVNGWHTVIFKNVQNNTLEVEVQINEADESIVMCVLNSNGFTRDQVTTIMNTFEGQF